MSPDNASTSAASGSGPAEANDGASSHSAENDKQRPDTTKAENNGTIAFDSESSTILLSTDKDGRTTTTTIPVKADPTTKDHKRKRSTSSGTEDGEIKEAPAPNVKRAKTSRITQSLWEGFGGERDFDLKSGWLYDPKRWRYCG